MKCWGDNGYGQLGDSSTTDRLTPVDVLGLSLHNGTLQAISFGAAPAVAVGGTGTVSATATSGLAVTFSSTTPSTCTVSGNIVTGVAMGTCTIAANQAGNANYNAAPQVTQNIAIQKANQTISVITISPATLGVGGTGTVYATATSGLAVSLSSMTTSVCTVSGNTVTGVAMGTCTIAANQAGNASYYAAPQKTQSFTVGAASATPTCTLTASPTSVSAGGTSLLTASCSPAATSYTWTGGTCTGTTSASCTVTPSTTTIYTVAGVNASGSGTAASATVTVNPPTGTANDNFANRIAITSTVTTGSNVGASKEAGEPNHVSSGGKSVWWTWTAPSSATVTINTAGSSFDTLLAVYTGTAVNALTLVASNDDAGGTMQSSVSISAIAGQTYQIAVDGYYGASGSISLNVSQAATPSIPNCTLTASSASISAGSSSTLTASCTPAATSYVWTGGTCAGKTTSTCTVTPASTTTYTVAGTNSAGTGTAASATVTVTAVTATPTCSLSQWLMQGQYILTASCSPAATSYTWTGTGCAGNTANTCTVTPTATTSYTVRGANAFGSGNAASATVTVTSAINADSIQRLYVAYFNRPADPVGLAAFEALLSPTVAATQAELEAIAVNFRTSQEYIDLYAGMGNTAIVNAMYNNLFGRDCESVAVLNAWTNWIADGTYTFETIALQLTYSAQGTDATAIANKLAAATAFTNALDTSAEIAGYSGTVAAARVRAWLASVTDVAATLTAAIATVDTVVASNVTPLGSSVIGTDTAGTLAVRQASDASYNAATQVTQPITIDTTMSGVVAYNADSIQRLYVAYFNRPADPAGLAAFEALLSPTVAATQAQLTTLAANFSNSAEYAALYAGQTNAQIIDSLYMNLFGRHAAPADRDYWAGQLTGGAQTFAEIALQLTYSAQGTDATAIANKLAAATAFTNALDTSTKIAGYSGTAAAARVRAWLASVTDVAATLTAATASVSTAVSPP